MVSTPEKQRNQLILEDNKWPYEVVCNEIGRDLLLEENQLPYFILQGLYELAFGKHNDQNWLIILTCKFILSRLWKDNIGGADVEGELTDKVVRMMGVSRDIRHLLDYLRIYLLPSSLETQLTDLHTDSSFATCLGLGKVSDILRPRCLGEPKNNAEFPKTASELSAAGVKFVAAKKRISLLDIEFNKGVLKIPNIIIQDTTESIFRSLMALEVYHNCSKTYFVDYIFFLDNLINTPQDVQVLVKNGIIDNLLGSNEAVANLFNNMTKNVALREDFYYTTVSQNLNQYASISWNRWKAVLKRDYFRHPWSTISVIYAIVLLILTILQTISGFSSQKIVVNV